MDELTRATSPTLPAGSPAEAAWRRPFLTTHPALAAAAREFARLTTDVVDRVALLTFDEPAHAPKVRRSPYRIIVQAGPVAVTLAWLRDRADSPAAAQLLVAVWRGTIAAVAPHQFERPKKLAEATAETMWVAEYTPEAESELSWRWRLQIAEGATLSSAEVADQCLAALSREYAACREDLAAD